MMGGLAYLRPPGLPSSLCRMKATMLINPDPIKPHHHHRNHHLHHHHHHHHHLQVKEVLDTFKVAARLGSDSLGAYVISMAQKASDVLAVELLQKEARSQVRDTCTHTRTRSLCWTSWCMTQCRSNHLISIHPYRPPTPDPDLSLTPNTPTRPKQNAQVAAETGLPPDSSRSLRVVPLFETLDDLDASGDVMTTLFGNEWYRTHLRENHDNHQEVRGHRGCVFFRGGGV